MSSSGPSLLNLETNEELRSLAVPEQFIQEQVAQWSHLGNQALSALRSDFLGALPARFTVELILDTGLSNPANPEDVRPQLAPLTGLSVPGKNGYPPPCLFTWGTVRAPVVVDDVKVHFLRFDPRGFPTRARVILRLSELRDKQKLGNSGSGPMPLPGASAPPSPLARLAAPVVGAVAAVAVVAGAALGRVQAAQQSISREEQRLREGVQGTVNNLRREVGERAEALRRQAQQVVDDIKKKANVDGQINELRSKLEAAKNEVEGLRARCGDQLERFLQERRSELTQLVRTFESKINFSNALAEIHAACDQIEQKVRWNETLESLRVECVTCREMLQEVQRQLQEILPKVKQWVEQLNAVTHSELQQMRQRGEACVQDWAQIVSAAQLAELEIRIIAAWRRLPANLETSLNTEVSRWRNGLLADTLRQLKQFESELQRFHAQLVGKFGEIEAKAQETKRKLDDELRIAESRLAEFEQKLRNPLQAFDPLRRLEAEANRTVDQVSRQADELRSRVSRDLERSHREIENIPANLKRLLG